MNVKNRSSLTRATAVALAALALAATHPVAAADQGGGKEKHPPQGLNKARDAFEYASDSAVIVTPTICAPGILCINAAGRGTGTHLKQATDATALRLDLPTRDAQGCLQQTATMVITSKPGDTVSLSLAAVNCPTAPLHSRSAGTWAVSSGSGRYAGATGGGTYFANIADTGGGRSTVHAEFVGILVRAHHDDDNNDAGAGHQTWVTVADMPTGREALGAAAGADGRIYAIGGLDASGPVDTVEAYTPGTPGSWATRASMPSPRYGLAVVAGTDGRIYAIGGNTYGGRLATLEVYTPSTDSWETKASMSSSRVFLSAAAGADGRIYAMGGLDDSGALATVEVYTPSSDSWAPATSMPTARQSFAAVAGADGRIYTMGGVFYATGGAYLKTLEAFTPNADAGTWATKASMQDIRSDFGAAAGADGRIYAIGGDNGASNLSSVEAYTPSTDSWVTVPRMPTRRASLAAAAGADGRIYAIGGQDYSNRNMQTVEAYTP